MMVSAHTWTKHTELTRRQAQIQNLSTIESLPTELKIMILYQINDVTSLENLMMAYPVYYAAYISEQDAIFTSITILQLKNRGLDAIRIHDRCFLQIRYGGRKDKINLQLMRLTLMRLFGDLATEEKRRPKRPRPKPLCLEMRHCLELLKIDDAVVWWFEYREDGKHCLKNNRMGREAGEPFWRFPIEEYRLFDDTAIDQLNLASWSHTLRQHIEHPDAGQIDGPKPGFNWVLQEDGSSVGPYYAEED